MSALISPQFSTASMRMQTSEFSFYERDREARVGGIVGYPHSYAQSYAQANLLGEIYEWMLAKKKAKGGHGALVQSR